MNSVWLKKIKSVKFWAKAVSGGAGALLATGQVPDVLLPLFSEGVYQALGGIVAAVMAAWLGKDHKTEKRRKTKADLMGVLLLVAFLFSGCTVAKYQDPSGAKISLMKAFTWQSLEGFQAASLKTDPTITIQRQDTDGIRLSELLQLLNKLQ